MRSMHVVRVTICLFLTTKGFTWLFNSILLVLNILFSAVLSLKSSSPVVQKITYVLDDQFYRNWKKRNNFAQNILFIGITFINQFCINCLILNSTLLSLTRGFNILWNQKRFWRLCSIFIGEMKRKVCFHKFF